MSPRIPAAIAALALCCAGTVQAQSNDRPAGSQPAGQQMQEQSPTASDPATRSIRPVVPVGPAVAPAGPAGPVVMPVIPVDRLDGVETVTLDTPRGPVVVVSWPMSNPLNDATNVPFNRYDTDRDGMLSRAEVEAAAKNGGAAQRLSARFDEMDASGDGKLSFAETVTWVYR